MRTSIGLIIFAGIGISLLILQMSGLAGVLGVSDTGDHRIDERFNDSAAQTPSVEGADVGQDSGLEFVASGLGTLVSWATGMALLPITFNNWLPWYLAYPFGLGIQALGIIGIAQIAGGPWR